MNDSPENPAGGCGGVSTDDCETGTTASATGFSGSGPSKYDAEIASEMLERMEKAVSGSMAGMSARRELEHLLMVHRIWVVQMMRAAYGMNPLPAVSRPGEHEGR